MDRFLELLRESVLVQAGLSFVLVCTACVLVVLGRDIPQWLLDAIWVTIGFYLGGKAQIALGRVCRERD